jgi:hypothetical protein
MKNQGKYHILVIGGVVAFRLFVCRNRQALGKGRLKREFMWKAKA